MPREVRSTRRLAATAAAVGIAALLATLTASSSAPAATLSSGAAQAGHTCLVMTGSGDPAFTKNFNPYTGTGLPSGAFVRGAFYEPLIITSVAGGGHTYPWLAQSWKPNSDATVWTFKIRQGVKFSNGKPMTVDDVVYSFKSQSNPKSSSNALSICSTQMTLSIRTVADARSEAR